MTLHAVAHGRRMDCALYVGGILVSVAGQTESKRSRRDQLYPGDVLIDPNFVATECTPWQSPSGPTCPWSCLHGR